jgi:hypothetical protein
MVEATSLSLELHLLTLKGQQEVASKIDELCRRREAMGVAAKVVATLLGIGGLSGAASAIMEWVK